MQDTGHINFFNIDLCGLYKFGSTTTTHGCEIDETFSLIMDWVRGRELASTIPWDPATSKPNRAKCYCRDIYKNEESGDYFLVLWKSDTDSAGTIWGAQEDNKMGQGKVVKYTNGYRGKKVIWGRPCYYWIMPKYNTIASIKFDHSVTDAQLLEDYVSSCITNRVKHEKREIEFTDRGYARVYYKGDKGTKYNYRFEVSLKSMNTSNSQLQNLAKRVTHIVRRETIKVNSSDERAEWVKKFAELVPLVSAKPKSRSRKIEIKAEAKPSANEIMKIIEKNAKEGRGANDWDNVGFATDSGITWVDRYRLKGSIKVAVRNNPLLNAAELAEAIEEKRGVLLAPIMSAQSHGMVEL